MLDFVFDVIRGHTRLEDLGRDRLHLHAGTSSRATKKIEDVFRRQIKAFDHDALRLLDQDSRRQSDTQLFVLDLDSGEPGA